MSTEALRHADEMVTSARTLDPPSGRGVAARLRQAVDTGRGVLELAAVVLSVPFVILAIGIPIALFVQLLLWVARSV